METVIVQELDHKKTLSKFIIFIFSFTVCLQVNSQVYVKEASPKWVKIIQADTVLLDNKNTETTSSGYNLAVADFQYNLTKNITYIHKVLNVISYSGITEASQLSVSIDTTYEKLKIHHLYIWRKGKIIDRTQDIVFKILHNEDKLDEGLYYGKITVYSNLDDVRKDDLVDFAYSVQGENPIFNDEKFLFLPLEDDFPIDYYSIRVLYDAERDYKYNCIKCDSNQVLTSIVDGNYRLLEIVKKSLKKFDLESNLPSGFIPYGYFTISSMKNWREVGEWAKGVFKLETEPNLDDVFTEIFIGKESQEEKINKILNYVQDEIRYMGIESGIGSIKPFHPNTIVKRRFGDCKDKSNLLVHLLKKIGINKAYPVLVNTNFADGLANFPASNQVFDHCIVRFDYQDSIYYIDPTIAQQGGNYRNTAVLDYGKVLIVGLESDSLQPMNIKNKFETFFKDEFFIKSFVDPVIIELQSKRYGINADIRRSFIELQPKDEVTNHIINDLKVKYTGIQELESPKYIDSIDKNEIICKYKFSIDKVWKDGNDIKASGLSGSWYFHFEPISVYQLLNDYDCKKRLNDYGLPFPFETEFDYIINFPKDILIIDNNRKWVTPGYTLSKRTKQLDISRVQITYNYRTNRAILTPEDLIKLCGQKEKIANDLSTVFYFKK
jgi:hypothetical protein